MKKLLHAIVSSLFAVVIAHAFAAEPPPPPIAPEATPEQILAAFDARWATLKDYSCKLDTKVRRGEKSTHDILDYSWKRPGLWRSHVVKGADEGSTVAKGADGKIRAKAGGVLSIITVTMAEDDKRLKDVRGATLGQADWGYMVGQFKKRREQGWAFTRLADEKIAGADCAVIQATGKADAMGETREAFAFEKANLAVRARRLFEGETQVDDTVYADAKLDAGLADAAFKP